MAKVPRPVGTDFEARVLNLFQRKQRHVLIGEASLETGYRLETCEFHLENLVHRGALRHVTPAERKKIGLHKLTVAYVLVDESRFTLVSYPL